MQPRPRNVSNAFKRLGVDSEADLWQQQADMHAKSLEIRRSADSRELALLEIAESDAANEEAYVFR